MSNKATRMERYCTSLSRNAAFSVDKTHAAIPAAERTVVGQSKSRRRFASSQGSGREDCRNGRLDARARSHPIPSTSVGQLHAARAGFVLGGHQSQRPISRGSSRAAVPRLRASLVTTARDLAYCRCRLFSDRSNDHETPGWQDLDAGQSTSTHGRQRRASQRLAKFQDAPSSRHNL